MTSNQLIALNRKCRILQRIRAGESYRAIAASERVVYQTVSAIAVANGFRQRTRIDGRVIESRSELTPAQATWRAIGMALDAYNRRAGRAQQ